VPEPVVPGPTVPGPGMPGADERPNLFAERFGHLRAGEMAEADEELRGTVPAGSLIDVFGVELTHVGPGAARASMTVGERHLNQAGVAQGGAIVALADAVAGWAAKTALRPGHGFTTVDLNITLVRPARLGQRLEATASPVHIGGRCMVLGVHVAVIRDEGPAVTVAECRCTQLVLS
jgi:uncharacterized protein (TIGR00369 family)